MSGQRRRRLEIESLEERRLLSVSADFDGSGQIDYEDYDLWTATFGSTSDLRADGNGDGVVNAADYTIWRDIGGKTPLAPTSLTSSVGVSGNDLDWADNPEPYVDSYNIYRSLDGGTTFELLAGNVVGSTFTDNATVPGTGYNYIVTAISNEGVESEFITETALANNGLLAYWAFDNLSGSTVTDDSGNGFDGTLTGATIVDGPFGKAVNFDGIDDFIDLPASAFDSLSNEVTIAFWGNGGPTAPKNSSVFQVTDNGTHIINIHHPWGNGRIFWDAAGDRIDDLASPSLYQDVWTHWAFTKNAATGEMKIYANGELWHSGTGETSTFDSFVPNASRLGGSANGNTYHDGAVDEFMVYNRELSIEEIRDLYLPVNEIDQESLSSRIPFDNAGSVIDLEGNLSILLGANASVEENSGQFGGAVRLDGGNDQAFAFDGTYSPSEGPITQRTISLWFSADATTGRQAIYERGGADRGFGIYLDGDTLHVGAWDDVIDVSAGDINSWSGTWRTTTVDAGKWHHVTIVLDASANPTQLESGVFKAYLDGVEFDSANSQGMQLYPLDYNIGIGAVAIDSRYLSGSAPDNLTGYVDDVTIWDRALSAEEVLYLSRKELVEDAAADFYVAPDGSDVNPGTKALPFATAEKARDAVRALKDSGQNRDFKVLFRGGTYTVENTIEFGVQDSAASGFSITYEAYPGETPVFSSGLEVDRWRRLSTVPDAISPDLSAAAQSNVWVAPIPGNLQTIYSLFDGDNRLDRSQEAGFLPTNILEGTFLSDDQSVVHFPEGAVQNGDNMEDWEIAVIPSASWSMMLLPVQSIDEQENILRTTIEGMYDLSQPRVNPALFTESVWLENTFRGLDSPGEWVVDSSEGLIYYWPTGSAPSSEIVAPSLTEIIKVEGNIDYDGPVDTPVKGLTFRGLGFTQAERYTWTEHRNGYEIMHAWERFDTASAMLRFRGVEDIVVEQSRFYNTAAAGIRFDLHAQNNVVNENVFENVGGVGVLLAGYGPGTKDVNKFNQVSENIIRDVGETYWDSPAVMIWQSGENTVNNNLIHDTPYAGVVISGRITWNPDLTQEASETIRWAEVESVIGVRDQDYFGTPDWYVREQFLHGRNNLILRNDLHDNVERLSDGNPIYVSGAGADNVIRENFVHDSPSPFLVQAIRSDDDQNELIVDRNIITRIGGWSEYIIIKGRSDVTNNIMAFPLNAPNRGIFLLKSNPGGSGATDGSVVQGNILYTNRAGDKVVNQSANAGFLSDTHADFNVYYNEVSSTWGLTQHLNAEQAKGSELNSIAANPLFVDAANDDFSFQVGSPATAAPINFIPIDMSLIGLGGSTGPSTVAAASAPAVATLYADEETTSFSPASASVVLPAPQDDSISIEPSTPVEYPLEEVLIDEALLLIDDSHLVDNEEFDFIADDSDGQYESDAHLEAVSDWKSSL